MNAKAHKLYNARKDLAQIFRYYSREAGLSIARRFRTQAEATFNHLVEMPHMGTAYGMGDLRFFPISGFEKHLIFYRTRNGSVEIIRVLHCARDISELLTN